MWRLACMDSTQTRAGLAALGLLLLLFVGSAAAERWPLQRYQECGSVSVSGVPGNVADITYASDADILWLATTSPAHIYRVRRSTGELLRSVDWDQAAYSSGRASRKDVPTVTNTVANLSIAFMDEEKVAIIDGLSPVITVMDFARPDGALRRDFSVETIPVGTVLAHISFNRALEEFYAVALSGTGRSLVRVTLDGELTPLLSSSSEAVTELGDTPITSMHYAANAARMFLLTNGAVPSVHQMSVKGKYTEERMFPQFGEHSTMGELKGIAFSRLGEAMLLISSEAPGKHVLHQMCQKIEPVEPLLAHMPEPYFPRPGFWYPLETYRPCGLPSVASFEGGQLNDLTVNPSSRTMWIATPAGLYEYSLTSELLRHVSSKQLANAAPEFGEVTSLAWLKAHQFLVGSSKTNTLALLDTDPETSIEEMVAAGVRMGGEPGSEEEDEEVIRRINKVQMSGAFRVPKELLPSGQSVGQLTVDDDAGFAFFSVVGEGPRRVMYTAINGTASGVLLSEGSLLSANTTQVTDILYSPVRRSMLVLAQEELVVKEVGNAAGDIAKEWKLPLYTGLPPEHRPKALHITPDGALMLLGSHSGLIQMFCTPEAEKSITPSTDDDSRKLIRSLSFMDNPVSWWMSVQSNIPAGLRPPSTPPSSPPAAWDPLADFDFPSPASSVNGINLPSWFLSLPLLDLASVFGTPPPTLAPTSAPTPAPTAPPPTPSAGGAGLPSSQATLSPTPAPTSSPTLPPGLTYPDRGDLNFGLIASTGCKDPNLDTFRNSNVEQCRAECVARPDCTAFTINRSGSCFLKATCSDRQAVAGDSSYVIGVASSAEPGVDGGFQATPAPTTAPSSSSGGSPSSWNSGDGGELVGGFDTEDLDDDECNPEKDAKCGVSENPGIKVGGITWHRMFAHKANYLKDAGNGVVEWQPYRDRNIHAQMFWKGSEILGFFDEPVPVKKNGETRVSFLFASEGGQVKECGNKPAKDFDCDDCEKTYGRLKKDSKNAYKYMYNEVRCYSGTGDFRVSMLDSGGKKITKDGYGYFNENVLDYKGLQWRFHPQACPTKPRAFHGPKKYVATSGSSWIRSNRGDRKFKNQWSLGCDYYENNPKLGKRSFKERMYSPDDGPMCLNLDNGELTDEDKPMTFIIKHMGESGGKTEFNFKLEFNGASFDLTEKWETELVPEQIDAISVSYTNSRSYFKLKLKRIE